MFDRMTVIKQIRKFINPANDICTNLDEVGGFTRKVYCNT